MLSVIDVGCALMTCRLGLVLAGMRVRSRPADALEGLDDEHTAPQQGHGCGDTVTFCRARLSRASFVVGLSMVFTRSSVRSLSMIAARWPWRAVRSDGCGASLGQRVDQEAADELVRLQRHRRAIPAFDTVVLVFERDAVRVALDETPVGDGDTVRVAREIGETVLRPTERTLGVDVPRFA